MNYWIIGGNTKMVPSLNSTSSAKSSFGCFFGFFFHESFVIGGGHNDLSYTLKLFKIISQISEMISQ